MIIDVNHGRLINKLNIVKMRRFIYYFFLIMMFLGSRCSINIRNNLPSDYTELHYRVYKYLNNNEKIDKSLCDGQLLMLQVAQLTPKDTISVYINGKLVLKNITTDYPFPYIDKKEYGGLGEHYYDFLLVKKTKGNKLFLVNLRDPKKKKIAAVSINDNLDICVVDEKGEHKTLSIPKNNDHFLEIRFSETDADTLQSVRLFD